ncbi:MAG: hypothetical protein IKZ49_02160 [Alphaproteobacteria bacterium]|nr:hypothetical protein [Alphaproteobacteria bacterium]
MQDDEKLISMGVISIISVILITAFLQVCYREQNKNINSVRKELVNVRHQYEISETKFSALSSADLLRNSVLGTNQTAEVVSFSKTINIDNIPMVQE